MDGLYGEKENAGFKRERGETERERERERGSDEAEREGPHEILIAPRHQPS